MQDERIEAALAGRYEVRIGDWIARGWELFLANWGPCIGYTVLYVIIGAVSRGLIELIIGAHLITGFYIVALKQLRGEPFDFTDFWRAFTEFVPFFLAGLLVTILIFVGFLFCILPGIYLLVSYALVYQIVWDRKIDFWEAMELSRKIVTAQWFSWFALGVVLLLINILGLLVCGLGTLVTIPLTYCTLAVAYEDVLGRPTGVVASAPPDAKPAGGLAEPPPGV